MEEKNAAMLSVVREDAKPTIPDRLEKFTRKYPDRLAFKSQNEALTWDALNRTANRLARTILAMGESRERPIALLVDQKDLIVAGLGVLKTGNFFVPLNETHPRARNRYILKETEATLIVTDGKRLPLARELVESDRQVVNVEELDSGLSPQNLGLSIGPDSICFVTYTSGSTGEPKGVVNTHRKVLHAITHSEQFEIGPEDRFTNLGSGERNPFHSLLSGAASYPWYVREEGLAHLADWLIAQQITLCRCGPRVFRQFVSSLTGEEEFPRLRAIILAGEPVRRTDVELYQKHFSSDCLLVNVFGAHEVGPIREYVIGKKTRIDGEMVPAGYEIPGKEVLLLDDNGRELGFNQVGEIAVRSRYLSPGYWRRPELTEAKFQPASEGGDLRIYLTGDLGRMLPDGCLEHLGRKDLQLKIRGLRVDLREVEKALLDHPSVKEATVTARQDRSGDNQLVAYFVPSTRPVPTVSSLRAFLKEKLPDYMIPPAFVLLDEIPLTATGTGKIDRRALPDPGHSRPDLDTAFVGPKTPVEQELSQIWAEVLSLEKVGIHDSFIELGGHSLIASQLISQVVKTFQVELPLRSLFEAPTVAEMAVIIAQNQAKRASQEELARMLTEVAALSQEEAQHLLAQESAEK